MEANMNIDCRINSGRSFLTHEDESIPNASLVALKALPTQITEHQSGFSMHSAKKLTALPQPLDTVHTAKKPEALQFGCFSYCIALFESFKNRCDADDEELDDFKYIIPHLYENAALYQFKLSRAIEEKHSMLKIVVPAPPFMLRDYWIFLYDFQIGEVIIFNEPLGKGQYKDVYQGSCLAVKNTYALSEQLIRSEAEQINVDQEIAALTLLKGKAHVLQLLHAGTSPSPVQAIKKIYHLVTELCDLGDLSKYKELSTAEKLRICCHIIKGLGAIHSIEFVHRDLKPANVLLKSVEGSISAVVADLGMACHITSPSLNRIKGSILYLPLEVLQSAKHNYQSDAWSLGVLFSVLFTGQMPFVTAVRSALEFTEVLAKYLQEHTAHQPAADNVIEHVIWSLLRPEAQRMTPKDALLRLKNA